LFDNFESTNNFMNLNIRSKIIVPILFLTWGPAGAALDIPDLEKAQNFLERGRIAYERSEYDSMYLYYSQAGAIFERENRPVQLAACFLGLADYYRMKNQLNRAEALLDSTGNYILNHIGPFSESHANALNAKARLLTRRAQYDQAIELLDQSLALLESLEAEPGKLAHVAYLRGVSYHYKGDLPKAEESYMEAYRTYQEIGKGPSAEKGWLLHALALLQGRKGNQPAWKDYIYQHIANNLAYFGPDPPDLMEDYSSLAGYFIDNGMADSARYYLEKCEEIEMRAPGENHVLLVSIYIQRARIYRLEGNYARALEYYNRAHEILQENDDATGFQARILYRNMGSLYKELGEYESAEKVLLNLLEPDGSVHPINMATNYYYLAEIESLLGKYPQSEYHLGQAMDIRGRYFSPDYFERGFDHLAYGILLDSLKRHEQARDFHLKAVEIIENNYGFHHLKTAQFLKSTGDHYALAGQQEKALACYQRSIHAMVPFYDTADVARNPAPEALNHNLFYLRLLKSKALALKYLAGVAQQGESREHLMKAAFSTYETSITVIDQLRNSYLGDRSKLYLAENQRETYEQSVESAFACYQLSGDPLYLDRAFMIAEKAKYATLLSVFHREESIQLAGIPDSVVQADARLRRELSVLQELLLENQGDTLYDSVAIEQQQAAIFELRARIEGLNQRLEREYPGYYSLLYSQQVLSPSDLRKKLRPSEILLEYFHAGNMLYRFTLSSRGMDCQRIALDAAFESELEIVRGFLSPDPEPGRLDVGHDTFLQTAHHLCKILMPASLEHARLIIIPDGKLSYFPFDILVTRPVEDFSGLYSQVPFLIQEHSIRYGYSATLMDRLEKGKRIRLSKLIAFAPGYGADTVLMASAADLREIIIDRPSLQPLPGSIREANEISRMTGGRAFTGETANEDLFKRLASECHIIHLAAHAFLDDDDPLQSKLVFSLGRQEEDGFLNVYEIYNMELAARMVVLSACNTGSGIMKSGEGIMSLARAFIYAGVPNIIMTLWTVSDRQSYKLMLRFYRQLIAGRSTENALRKAKLEYLAESSPSYQHPRYWAGYILVGNPDRLMLSRLYKLGIPVLFVTLLGLMVLIIRRRKISG
jgi:tetratricopeptide (TPR) repeat protein